MRRERESRLQRCNMSAVKGGRSNDGCPSQVLRLDNARVGTALEAQYTKQECQGGDWVLNEE